MAERPTSAALTLFTVLLVAANLRPALASMGPVLEALRTQLHLSRGTAGLLTSIPILCMGVFAAGALSLQQRLGQRRSMLIALMLLALGLTLRIIATSTVQFISAALVGIALAWLAPMLSGFIKQHYREQAGQVSAWSTTALCLGASIAALVAAELTTLTSWPVALASMALPAWVALWLWWRLPASPVTTPAAVPHSPWRQWRAWVLLLSFGASSLMFFALLAWLTPVYIELGLSVRHAGHVLGVFTLVQILGAFVTGWYIKPGGDRRLGMFLCGGLILIGLWGLYAAPLGAAYLWATLLGLGTSGLFALHMILPLDFSDDAEDSLRWTAMMSSGGFIIAAAGPTVFGLLRDLTHGYDASLLLLVTMTLSSMLCSIALSPKQPLNNPPSHAERHAL